MKKSLILSVAVICTLLIGSLAVYARDYIVNNESYSIGANEKKTLVNNWYIVKTMDVNGNYSAITSGNGNESTKFVLAKSPKFGWGYFNVETKTCATNIGAFLTFNSVLGDTYMKITNDNTDGAAWHGNVRFYF